jgi:adenylate cyclase class IV
MNYIEQEVVLLFYILEFHKKSHELLLKITDYLIKFEILERLNFESISDKCKMFYIYIVQNLVYRFHLENHTLGTFPSEIKTHLKRIQIWQSTSTNEIYEVCHKFLKELQFRNQTN